MTLLGFRNRIFPPELKKGFFTNFYANFKQSLLFEKILFCFKGNIENE